MLKQLEMGETVQTRMAHYQCQLPSRGAAGGRRSVSSTLNHSAILTSRKGSLRTGRRHCRSFESRSRNSRSWRETADSRRPFPLSQTHLIRYRFPLSQSRAAANCSGSLSDSRKCRRFQAAGNSKLPFTERRFRRCRSCSRHHIHAIVASHLPDSIACGPGGINQRESLQQSGDYLGSCHEGT
jgi:hypothetical protein